MKSFSFTTVSSVISQVKKTLGSIKQFSDECELMALLEILNNWTSIDKSLQTNTALIEALNSSGPDLVFKDNKNKVILTVEVKGSRLKQDYLNKNYPRVHKPWLYINALKEKDFYKSEETVADIVIFVCRKTNSTSHGLIGLDDFWIFNRDDINQLYPKASIFIPSFIPTIMINDAGSHLTDEFIDLRKGYKIIVLPPFDINSGSYILVNKLSGYTFDFINAWNCNINCYLVNREHEKIVDYIWMNPTRFQSNWSKIVLGKPYSKTKVFGNIAMRNQCYYYNPSSAPKKYHSGCLACNKLVNMHLLQ